MAFKVEKCSNKDMAQTFAIISEGFGHGFPQFEACYPKHDTAAGRAAGAERMQAFKDSEPFTTFVKATDTETGEIVAVAKWNIYDGDVGAAEEPRLEGDYWDNEHEKEFANAMWAGYTKPRRDAIRETGGKLVSLDMESVLPAYQKKGAGRMLLRWGLEIADKKGYKAVVEAGPQGSGLYAKEGFEMVTEQYAVKLPEKFSDRETSTYNWMVRPAKT